MPVFLLSRVLRRWHRQGLALLLLAGLLHPLPAMVVIDCDLVRLRQSPEARRVAEVMKAAMPWCAGDGFAALSASAGWALARDLDRVLVTFPDQGKSIARLVGLPARRLAAALEQRGPGQPVRTDTGYPLPDRPDLVFVAIADDQALIGRPADLAAAPPPEPLALAEIAIHLRLTAGASVKLPALAPLRTLEVRADQAGHCRGEAEAVDGAGAMTMVRTAHTFQRIAALGALTGSASMQVAHQAFADATVRRDGSHLTVAVDFPAELQGRLIDLVIRRLTALSRIFW